MTKNRLSHSLILVVAFMSNEPVRHPWRNHEAMAAGNMVSEYRDDNNPLTQIVVRDEARDLSDKSSWKEKARNPQTDPPLAIKNRIARRRERIARWDKKADEAFLGKHVLE